MKAKVAHYFMPTVATLFVAFLLFVAFTISIRSSFFNFRGGPLSNEPVKAAWALLAAGFAAAVSLIGLALTNLHNRRTHRLAEESERRLQLESVVKSLELLTDGQEYAPKARVAGSLATLVRLGHISIAVGTLRAAWTAKAVDAEIAAWLTDRAIEEGTEEDVFTVSTTLVEHASELAVEWEHGLITHMRHSLRDNWNTTWPQQAKVKLIGMLTLAHISVKPEAWINGTAVFLKPLWRASQDDDPLVGTTAAKALAALAPRAEDLRPLFGTRPGAIAQAEEAHRKVEEVAAGTEFFPRIAVIVGRIKQWQSTPSVHSAHAVESTS
jgi:hypothetical protein